MSHQPAIRIAISGGGLAGSCLMHALLTHHQKNLDVHIFESASAFKEAGAAIGVTQNALRALKLIGASTPQCLEDAGAVPLLGIRYHMARGADSGKEFDRLDAIDQPITSIVHRADFLRELLKDVPVDRMHTSKQLVDIDEAGEDGPVTLSFSDGTSHKCDVLIGADGIRSRVRGYILGEDDPAATPVPAGWWFVAALKPYDEAVKVLGKEFLDLEYPVEYQFSGEGAWWMHNSVSKGSLVQCLISVKCDDGDEEAATQWKKSISADEIREIYRDWPSPIKGAVEELLCDKPTSTAMYLWQHLPARTYVKGAVAVIGDAAHATTPWMSSGVGMSIEDSMVLSKLLGRSTTPREARIALNVYDEIRRPRTLRIVEASHGTGLIGTGTKADFDMYDAKQMKENLSPRWNFIRYLDLEEHGKEAVRLMDSKLAEIPI